MTNSQREALERLEKAAQAVGDGAIMAGHGDTYNVYIGYVNELIFALRDYRRATPAGQDAPDVEARIENAADEFARTFSWWTNGSHRDIAIGIMRHHLGGTR